MGYQKETSTCTGRGFADTETNGFLAKFKTWVVKATGAGGPGYTLLRDKSTLPTAQTITTVVNTDTLEIVGHGFTTGDRVQYTASASPISGLVSGTFYYVILVSVDRFKFADTLDESYEGIAITGFGALPAGTHTGLLEGPYIVVSSVPAPTITTSQILLRVGYITTESAFIRVTMYLGWATDHPISIWGGHKVNTLDAATFTYDFRGGTDTMIIQSRIGTAISTAGVDRFIGDAARLLPESIVGNLQGGITAGSSVVLQLAGGEAAFFTVNRFYYIFDFSGHNWINYFEVTNVNVGADQITASILSQDFPAGAIVTPYFHRYWRFGSDIGGGVNQQSVNDSGIPYMSSTDQAKCHYITSFASQNVDGSVTLGKLGEDISRESPNDRGLFGTQRPTIVELNFYDGANLGNRGYGQATNVFLADIDVMQKVLDGRTIGGNDYVFFQKESEAAGGNVLDDFAMLFLDTTSI